MAAPTTPPPSDRATLLNALSQERLETVRKAEVVTAGTTTFGLVAFEGDNSSQESGALRIWRKDPSGWTQIDRLSTEGEVQDISTADFTGDGALDALLIVNTTYGRYTSIASSAPCNNACWKVVTFESVDEVEGTLYPTSTLDGTIATPRPGTIVNTLSCSPDCDPVSNVQTYTWSPARQLFEVSEVSGPPDGRGD